MYTVEYSLAIKNEIFPFAGTQMDSEGIMLSEVIQRKGNTIRYYSYVESKKYNKLVNITKRKQTHRYRGQTSSYQWESEREEAIKEQGIKRSKLSDTE